MNQGKLKEAKEILISRGMKPQDYSHLTYDQILQLAGAKK